MVSQKKKKPSTKVVPEKPRLQRWVVVGGVDKGGIVVREGREFTSEQLPERLSTGAIIEEEELQDNRLRFSRISGAGPDRGWITIHLKERDLVTRVNAEEPRAQESTSFLPSLPRIETQRHPRSAPPARSKQREVDPFHLPDIKNGARDVSHARRSRSLPESPRG